MWGIAFFGVVFSVVIFLVVIRHRKDSKSIRRYAIHLENKQNGEGRGLIFVNDEELDDYDEDEIQAIGAENEEEAEEMLFW